MLIRSKPTWEISESQVTPEAAFLDRRRFLAGMLTAAGGAASGVALASRTARASQDPSADFYPVPNNPAFTAEREIAPVEITSRYNNFYEFNSPRDFTLSKDIADAAQALPIRPWEIQIVGLVEKTLTLDIDDLLRRMPLEERIYRHRCVEAWSMVVPWAGFPMKELVKLAQPTSDAKYIYMETFLDLDVAPGQHNKSYPWPYREAVTMEEATNDLAFLVTGIYNEPLLKQYGAPLRLALPWKYGFKSIKSIVKFRFDKRQPQTFWHEVIPREYGFWANVNPEVPHRRWSQATERDIGSGDRVPTRLFNGYEEHVAHLYAGMENLGDALYR